jgi:Tfp pilus assembly protein PilV
VTDAPRSEHGSTLIEVLISVVVLGLAITALLGGMTTTVGTSSIGGQRADAETILTSAGEAVRDPNLNPYACNPNVPAYSTVGPGTASPPSSAWKVNLSLSYWDGAQWQSIGSSTPPPPCGALQKITINVTNSPTGQVSMSRDFVKGPSS